MQTAAFLSCTNLLLEPRILLEVPEPSSSYEILAAAWRMLLAGAGAWAARGEIVAKHRNLIICFNHANSFFLSCKTLMLKPRFVTEFLELRSQPCPIVVIQAAAWRMLAAGANAFRRGEILA